MGYTTIEDVEKKFNELYEWDKRKFINEHVDTYCNLDDYFGDYDNLVDALEYISKLDLDSISEKIYERMEY